MASGKAVLFLAVKVKSSLRTRPVSRRKRRQRWLFLVAQMLRYSYRVPPGCMAKSSHSVTLGSFRIGEASRASTLKWKGMTNRNRF